MMNDFDFRHLDHVTRMHMLDELESDIETGSLQPSRDFNNLGRTEYPAIMRVALSQGDVASLALALIPPYFNDTRTDKNGKVTRLNHQDCALRFSVGEFNRFYLRGLCIRATSERIIELIVYRAKLSGVSRSESQAMIGRHVIASELLADLRANKGLDTHLGVPMGPHSGLSACYPENC